HCLVRSTAILLVLNTFGSTGRFGLTRSHEAFADVVDRSLPDSTLNTHVPSQRRVIGPACFQQARPPVALIGDGRAIPIHVEGSPSRRAGPSADPSRRRWDPTEPSSASRKAMGRSSRPPHSAAGRLTAERSCRGRRGPLWPYTRPKPPRRALRRRR